MVRKTRWRTIKRTYRWAKLHPRLKNHCCCRNGWNASHSRGVMACTAELESEARWGQRQFTASLLVIASHLTSTSTNTSTNTGTAPSCAAERGTVFPGKLSSKIGSGRRLAASPSRPAVRDDWYRGRLRDAPTRLRLAGIILILRSSAIQPMPCREVCTQSEDDMSPSAGPGCRAKVTLSRLVEPCV